MTEPEELISLQVAIDNATDEFGEDSDVVNILNGVMKVLTAKDYYPMEIALADLEELCR